MTGPNVHSLLIDSGVLAADLVTAGVVSAAEHVYAGRRPRFPKNMSVEVQIERANTVSQGTGFQGNRAQEYLLRVFVRDPGNAGSDGAGSTKIGTLVGHMKTIRERYHGTRTFYGTVSEIHAISCTEVDVDEVPNDRQQIAGVLSLVFHVTDEDP